VAALADVRTLKLNLLADVDKFGQGMKDADKYASGLDDNIGRYSKNMAKAFGAVVVAAGVMAVQIGIKAIDAASDLEESLGKVGQIFGGSGKEVVKFSKTTAKNLGISQKDALDAASTFATFGKSAGLAGQDLVDFSEEFTVLAADFASFYNTSPEDAILAIGAALRGESEPIRKYGVLLDDNTLKQQALEDGIYDGNGALTAQEKVMAASRVIMDQSKDATGDFARTSDGLANQSRITKARIEDLKTEIGEGLLPIALNLVTFFQDKVLPIVEDVADGFGGKDPNGLSARAIELGASLGDTGAYSLGASLKTLSDSFGALFKALSGGDADGANSTLQTFADVLNAVAGAIENVAAVYKGGKTIGGKLLDTIIIGEGKGGYLSGLPGLSFGNQGPAGQRAAGGSVMGGQPYRVGEFGPEMFVPSGSGSIRPDNGSGQGVTIIMNGVIDGESARRSIERLLQDSSRRTGAVNLVGATL
jgi:hypothetical protein